MGKGATRSVEKLGRDSLTTVKNTAGDTVKVLTKAKGDTITTIRKASSDTVRTVEKAGRDATATYVKAWRDVGDQTKRGFHDAVDAEKAWINFEKNQLRAQRDSIEHADKRLRDGKVIDAMWGLATEPSKASEKNFAQATQESELINQAAGTAAAVYGGPAGAAAYAAWSTYRRTGNADLAFRAGLMAGATAQLGSSVASMPSGTAGEILKKAAMAGAAGGISVAAAGGDEKAIKEAFLKSAGTVLVQGGHEKLKAYSPKMADAYDSVQCISARDVDCLTNTTWARDVKGKLLYDEHGVPRIDPTKLDPKSYIGKWTHEDPNSAQGKVVAFIAQVSKLPQTEVIPVLNNQWVLTWTIGINQSIPYKRPTAVLTYIGAEAPFVSTVEYGKQPAALPASVANAGVLAETYQCPFEGNNRMVRVTTTQSQCSAIYTREIGGNQIVWESTQEPEICAPKAAQFVEHLRRLGIECANSH